MSQTPPPSIDTPPLPAPQRNDRATFSNRVDDFVTWLYAVVSQFLALASNVYDNAVDAYNNALSAAGSAAAAATTAGTTVWVSGATIQQYAKVISPADWRTYLRKTATGSGTTDPSADPTNYSLVSLVPMPVAIFSQRVASGTAGGTGTTGQNTRVLNTTDFNDIVGSSLGSNTVTLPAGTYYVHARAPAHNQGLHQLALYNSSDSTNAVVGSSASTVTAGSGSVSDSMVSGRFTITANKNFTLRHYLAGGASGNSLGIATSSGNGEVYAEVTFTKVL